MTDLNRNPVEVREGWFEQYVVPSEAPKRIRGLTKNRATGKNRAVYLSVEQKARTEGDRYFPVLGSVNVGCTAACKYVEDAYKNFEARGALVKLVWCDSIVFVG